MLKILQHSFLSHYVTKLLKRLRTAVASAPFDGSQRKLCLAAKVDRGQFHHVLSGKLAPTPRIIGRVALVLPKRRGQELIDEYLQQIAEEIAQAQEEALAQAQ